ncbi:MAG: arginine repressor [Clostridiales Family XIII bacterium]|jgi:transcriptional regulator of arginine metabolism|nr:arginine repressor [Clostridiales Family XIII bacterium]
MRYSRQNKILEIIENHDVDTQENLAEMLKNCGFDVTQATISRDIKELQLVKTLTHSGKYKYTAPGNLSQPITDRFVKIFKETIQSVTSSGNMIVIKTLSGCANAAAETIDSLDFPHILGSIAGDNTIFLVIDDPKNVHALTLEFDALLK